jgi:hypothetical protein
MSERCCPTKSTLGHLIERELEQNAKINYAAISVDPRLNAIAATLSRIVSFAKIVSFDQSMSALTMIRLSKQNGLSGWVKNG